MRAYIAYQSNEKRSSAAEVTGILTREKAKRDAELAAKHGEMREFQQANKGVEVDSEKSNLTMQRLNRRAARFVETILLEWASDRRGRFSDHVLERCDKDRLRDV